MIRSLTSLRFIVAFVVFSFHCRIHFDWKVGLKVVDDLILNGATFMTGFFVLSGFIMSHVYDHTDFSSRENIFHFYLKRFAKIYPTYALSTIIYFIFLHDFTFKQMSLVFVNDAFLVQGFFKNMFDIGINGGTWSLTVEIFLYFLFPFLILLSAKSPKILIGSLLIALITSFNSFTNQSEYIYANPVFRVADFMCGMGFYSFREKFKYIKFGKLLHLVVVISLLYACGVLGKAPYMCGQFVIIPLFGIWIVMVYHSNSRIYNNKAFIYFGSISYSFYLYQFISMETGKRLTKAYPDLSLGYVFLAALAVSFAVSALSYHLWEERMRKLILLRYSRKASDNCNPLCQ